ncbi:hypothetical protein JZ751_000963 [Albula glossodonta]|uniref:Laminin subunit alpha-3 n=1 Tax=Albula glossodonta TaxID=121402 RepID=A0A8T2PXI9_9TELE|nr:hypothetical protein JZ751_000963 [Albula glossodonta]
MDPVESKGSPRSLQCIQISGLTKAQLEGHAVAQWRTERPRPPGRGQRGSRSAHHVSRPLSPLRETSGADRALRLFHVAYVLIKFANSPRPDLWVLERSLDHGRTYTPWQYFAHLKRDCIEFFGKQPNARITRDDDQLCTTEYSRIVPLENGEIVVSLVNGRPGARNFTYSPVLRDFTKATNIRLRFLRTSTLLGHLISKAQRDPTVTRRCECQHNTCGESCDRCCPGFNQKPWRAATADSANECQPCQCHSHATDCYYDPEVDRRRASLNIYGQFDGGGVCRNCQHNTDGVNCERCKAGFYRPYGVQPDSPNACEHPLGCPDGYFGPPTCQPCQCNGPGVAVPVCDKRTGDCKCRPGYEGRYCDRCVQGRFNYPYCQGCACTTEGTLPQVCEASGRCLCRPEVEGPGCDRCRPGYHSFPNCQACRCEGVGVADRTCGPRGECRCHPNYAGDQCERCAQGYYGYPNCAACQCSRDGSYAESCDLVSGQCHCRPGVTGQRCDRCVERGSRFPQCEACRCEGPGVADRTCGPGGECRCRPIYAGRQCERCAQGYYGYPNCAVCQCSRDGSYDESCDLVTGQCRCRPGVTGQRCDRCIERGSRFPQCEACRCEGLGVADRTCGPGGECRCRPNYAGRQCERCAQGYYGYPNCAACQCSRDGSYDESCDLATGQCRCRPGDLRPQGRVQCERCAQGYYGYPNCAVCQCSRDGAYDESCDLVTGQCRCRPGVTGQRCDRCIERGSRFPQCEGSVSRCNPVGTDMNRVDVSSGYCPCLPEVEGPLCDRCKPLYWNLAPENPNGCIECQCDLKGTLSGVGECEQKKNYFGCQGCECDVGGALGPACAEPSGQCKCRKHVEGRTCNQPEANYYFPDLHHMKYEVEDGITPNARPPEVVLSLIVAPPGPYRIVLRYSTSSRPRSEVRITVHVDGTERALFRIILRYANPGSSSVTGRTRQSKEVVFPPSPTPAFLTVPGNGFAEPFPLTPGRWIIHIQVEDVLLDYLVLLPSSYYEAPILQSKITDPCTYLTSDGNRGQNCLLYRHAPMDRFPAAPASQGVYSSRGRRKRQARLTFRVPAPGQYVVVLEYASEVDTVQNVNVIVGGDGQLNAQAQARVNIDSCAYSFLCRGVAVDQNGRVAELQLDHKSDLLFQTSTAAFLLHKVYAVPAEDFYMEYVEPKPICVSVHGRFTEDSRYCVPSQYELPPSALILDATRQGRLSVPSGGRRSRQVAPLPLTAPQRGGVLLKSPQTEISFSTRVPAVGRHMFVIHYRQPEHPSFPVEVRVDAGRLWKGSANASFCPRASGCRDQVIAEQRIALDLPRHELSVTLRVPPGKTLILDYILVVPDERYRPDLLKEQPLGKASDFISQCGRNSFYIDSSSSQFCQDSARSLVAHFNDGALPCECNQAGSTGPTCAPMGGQCPCKPNIIGRQCTRCAVGHYGFPYCRACNCGKRLCDEVTGQCICPPQTVQPACDECVIYTFSYHPLLGCEGCDCSPIGITSTAGENCDPSTGQCTCKERIEGRQCDHCSPGYYRFPECIPCDCNMGGVVPDVCHPETGECLCKKNVVGAKCDRCREGSFHFDESNPSGCTSCFCFGATDQCQSSDKRRGKKMDQEEVPSVFNPASNTAVADVQELPATVQNLHWVAPPSYLGDRVSSYGGYLTYQVKSFGIPSEGMVLLDRRPDVLLTDQDMTLVYRDPSTPTADRLYQGRVQLVEGNFRHDVTERPVTREEMMTVLAGLDSLWIRGLYFTQSQRLSLGEVGLEEATPTGSGVSSSTVEKCAPGYYRDRSVMTLGRCVPCSCNGLSNECDETTGRCLNCQSNTAGDRCEQCKEGYYGNATERTCRVCPCPFNVASNSFAIGCRKVSGGFMCVCKQGYAGARCEKCAPGYYGDPMALRGSCQPCNCNGNPSSCDSRTGVCKNTLEPKDTNTEEQCQECDSCVMTLLADLETLEEELSKLKSQLENVSAGSAAQDRLKKLEDAITATKTQVNKYNASISSQIPKVKQLEKDATNLNEDIGLLKKKAGENSENAKKAVDEADNTHKRAQDLLNDAQNMFMKIKDLLAKLKDATSSGSTLPTEDLAKIMDEAERMVTEMKGRDFTGLKDAAEKERDEARKLLDHIKTNVTKQHDLNKENAKRIEGLLKEHDAKIKDLEQALKEAEDNVKKANRQNDLNGRALEDYLKQKKDLEKERDKVADQIAMAKDQLKATKNLLDMLDASKKEYEELAAQLDGAKTDLTKKVNDITRAAAKEDIVKKAEKHADTLAKLAKDLQEAVKNASSSSDVRCAVDAIDAYKNITEAIEAAEKAANEAKKAADKALKDVQGQDLTKRAKDLKNNGNRLLKEAKDAQKDLQDSEGELDTQKKRLNDAKKKKDDLKNSLDAAQAELANINRDDIADKIDAAKRIAANANNTANDAMDRLDAIREEVEKINILPGDSNLDKVLSDIESLGSEMSPTTNVSDNIKRIKELIQLARDAANRITVPMKFMGDGHVELRTPDSMDDLKAYTALSLSLQRPEDPNSGRGDGSRGRRQSTPDDGNLFVLYLGKKDASKDYIGMALRSNQLFCIYKLNGVEYEVKTDFISKSPSEPSYFDRVDLRRIYEDAEVILTKLFTSSEPDTPVTYSNKGEITRNLLNLDPEDIVFYVGGYPDHFTPPPSLKYPKYRGCIEMSTFNERFISLYNFKKAVNVDMYFEGSGYAKVAINKMPSVLVLAQSIYTRSENALLLYIGDEESYYMVTVEEGYVVLRGRDGEKVFEKVKSVKKEFPLEKREDVQIVLSKRKTIFVRIGNTQVITASYNPKEYQSYYIGGLPPTLRERDNIMNPPLKGCLRNIKMGGSHPTIEERVGMSRGCPADFLASRKAEFSQGSSLSMAPTGFSLAGDMTGTGMELSMQNGFVLFKFKDKVWKSDKTYNDGKWHYLTVTKKGQRLELLIDEEDKGKQSTASPFAGSGTDIFLGKDTFKGCLTNLYMRRPSNMFKAEDLSTFTSKGTILMDVCTADRPPLLMLANRNRSISRMVGVTYA